MDLLPKVNDPIVLRDEADLEYRSRVEDLGPDHLTVARPLGLGSGDAHGPGTDMLVTWKSPRGVAVLPTRILGAHSDGGVQLWSMAVTGAGWVEQRREFVRVAAAGPVTLRPGSDSPAEEAIRGHLVDLSEAALRCTVDAALARLLQADDPALVAFRFGDREFTLPARVRFRRPSSRPTERVELVVVFDEPVTDADALRKQIYAQQLRALRLRTDGT